MVLILFIHIKQDNLKKALKTEDRLNLTARNAQVTASLMPDAGLLPCCRQAHIRMRSHHIFRLGGKKFAASCQQICFKLIIKTFYPQA